MAIALSILLSIVLLLLSPPTAVPSTIGLTSEHTSDVLLSSPAAAPYSAMAPGADDCGIYIVFVSRADYVDTVEYDVRLLASVVGRLVVYSVWQATFVVRRLSFSYVITDQ
jgi:hypothetical protein